MCRVSKPDSQRCPPCAGHIDQLTAVAAFFATLPLLAEAPPRVQLAEVALVGLALWFKYVVQGYRAEWRYGLGDYWWPHCLWHLFVAMGQALLVAALPP